MKPKFLDEETFQELLDQGAEYQLFDFSEQLIEGFTTNDPMNTPFEFDDIEEREVVELWPTPEGTYEYGGTIAFWSVAA